jgi:hypothetical protein
MSAPPSCQRCKINIGQKIDSSQTVTLNASITKTSELQSQLSTALQQSASTLQKSQQDSLATAISDQSSDQNLNTSIENLVQNNITTNVTNQITALLNNANSGIITLYGNNDDMVVTSPQEILSKQVTNLISNALLTDAVKNAIGNDVKQEGKSVQDIKQTGLLSDIMKPLAGLIGGAMAGTLLYFMCPCIVLICCICACCHGKGGGGKKGSDAPAAAFGKKLKKQLNNLKMF